MGIEVYIVGMRRLTDQEVEALNGMSLNEIEESDYFKNVLSNPPADSCYRGEYREYFIGKEHLDSVRHMYRPVRDDHGRTVYVVWREMLGYYWHKAEYDRSQIESLLDDMGSSMNWDDSYHVADYGTLRPYMNTEPSKYEGEIYAFLYG
jgi:hypothetical protein